MANAAIPIELTASTPILVFEIYDLFAESIIYTCSHYLISSEAAKPANLPEVHAKPEANPSYAG
mgnify:FL=1